MVKYKKKGNEGFVKTMQKNRFSKKKKNQSLDFGSLGLKFLHEGFLEFKHVIKFKRIIKKMVKKVKRKMGRKWRIMARKKKKKATSLRAKSFMRKLKRFKRKKLKLKKRFFWWHLFPNFLLSEKSTNARMGKGKGSPKRWLFRVCGGLFFLRFSGYNFYKVYRYFNGFKKRLPVRFFFVYNWKKNVSIGAGKSKNITYWSKKRFK